MRLFLQLHRRRLPAGYARRRGNPSTVASASNRRKQEHDGQAHRPGGQGRDGGDERGRGHQRERHRNAGAKQHPRTFTQARQAPVEQKHPGSGQQAVHAEERRGQDGELLLAV